MWDLLYLHVILKRIVQKFASDVYVNGVDFFLLDSILGGFRSGSNWFSQKEYKPKTTNQSIQGTDIRI